MFPLFFLLGFKTMEEFMVSVGLTQNTVLQPMKLVNQIMPESMDKLTSFLHVYEGFHAKAYNLGDGKITIGYGSTNWLSPSGSVIRAVKLGDTITVDDAKKQVLYYFVNVINQLRVRLQSSNIAVVDNLLISLLQTLYMTGGGAVNYTFFNNILVRSDKNTNLDQVAEIYKSEVVKYFKSLKQNPSTFPISCTVARKTGYKWDCYGLGWTRRISASMDLIKGISKPKSWYDSNVKKSF